MKKIIGGLLVVSFLAAVSGLGRLAQEERGGQRRYPELPDLPSRNLSGDRQGLGKQPAWADDSPGGAEKNKAGTPGIE